MEVIGELAEAGSPAAIVAFKQLIGEDALPYVEAQREILRTGLGVVVRRQDFLRAFSGGPPAAGYGDAANRAWVSGFGSWAKQRNTTELFGYRFESRGLVVGYDRELAGLPGLTLGVDVAVSQGTLKNNDGLAETDVDAISGGIYGLYQFGGGLFLYADLTFGRASYDAEIRLLNSVKRSDFGSSSFSAGFGGGYGFWLGDAASLTASAGLRYTRIKQDGWRERIASDPDNLAVANWFGEMSKNYLDIDASLKLETTRQVGSVVIQPEVHAGVVFTADSSDKGLRVGFAGSDSSLTLNGLETGKTRFQAGAGGKLQVTENVDFGLSYELETRKGYTAHYGQLVFGISY